MKQRQFSKTLMIIHLLLLVSLILCAVPALAANFPQGGTDTIVNNTGITLNYTSYGLVPAKGTIKPSGRVVFSAVADMKKSGGVALFNAETNKQVLSISTTLHSGMNVQDIVGPNPDHYKRILQPGSYYKPGSSVTFAINNISGHIVGIKFQDPDTKEEERFVALPNEIGHLSLSFGLNCPITSFSVPEGGADRWIITANTPVLTDETIITVAQTAKWNAMEKSANGADDDGDKLADAIRQGVGIDLLEKTLELTSLGRDHNTNIVGNSNSDKVVAASTIQIGNYTDTTILICGGGANRPLASGGVFTVNDNNKYMIITPANDKIRDKTSGKAGFVFYLPRQSKNLIVSLSRTPGKEILAEVEDSVYNGVGNGKTEQA